MLLVKPLLLRRDHQEGRHDAEHGDEEFAFSEVLLHQTIETIEFVLGSISNTASYLRLWALSLAHSQLSVVFYQRCVLTPLHMAATGGLSFSSIMLIAYGWWIWAGFTAGVLLAMEALSAFLHTLRLHWVEFQNKFYNLHGPGEPFVPFSHRKLLKKELAETAEQ